MYLLRRSAARALSATPLKTPFVKPRSITTYTPAFQAPQQRRIPSKFQRRFASDEAAKSESAESAAVAAEELAQTKPEAPVEENLTRAQQNTQQEPTDALSSVSDVSSEGRLRRSRLSLNEPNTMVYVGNLFYEVGEEQLRRIFSRFGNLKSVRIVRDFRHMSRGFGYVEYETIEDARAAIDNLDMQIFEGRNLVVQFHKPKLNKRPGREPLSASQPTSTLFIGNIAYEMSDKDLNDLFRDIRNVTDVRVAVDRRTGQPRGFAHADFVDRASAQKAYDQLQGKVYYGRRLKIDFSDSPKNKKPADGKEGSVTEPEDPFKTEDAPKTEESTQKE
ncbi:uncharacterized protein EI97DRAFT_394261 [Westerdykella ornata]|uniref:RRM domain-containing protein n=1 Tax=Westerdykella ornata TaxID=318751 RepID=A0A6A6JND5_WESOR|nr:uncharacterized protein EI97DRAFT_394261 [Westerdykella ornata]KAF2278140.1 hypothetical protein EI97DRAFT_394261 [Westerdykella ornata]